MAALSSVFLRPRALGVNPFTGSARREDFMRTTGVYKVAMVGGGGGGGGPTGLYYGAAGSSATAVLGTVQVRDGVTVQVGSGGRAGSQGEGGGNGGQTYLLGASTAIATAGAGGGTAAYFEPVNAQAMYYRVISGGARPNINFSAAANSHPDVTEYIAGRGGRSGLTGYVGQIFYNLIFRVA